MKDDNCRSEPGYYGSLEAALDKGLTLLTLAAANRRSALHTFSVATLRGDGLPSIRTVVLRTFDKQQRLLTFHTDIRSRKFPELSANPFFAAHFYDPGEKTQMRLDCEAALNAGDGISRRAWERAQSMSKECYKQSMPSGAPIADPSLADERALTEEGAYANFAVVSGRILSMEWLYLAAAGHRRAYFSWREEVLRQSWLAP